ncbi:MAG: zinc-ribbon domain containing protein [Chloroflexi bacterium]|nr:zinc-ribbon domain containing protein [Chloroflexota bacterium]
MSFQDKSIQCSDCGITFTFTSGEQEFFSSKGYTNEPKRCPSCRQAKKSESGGNSGYSGGGGGYSSSRQMFPATCAQCGKDTEVPFQPRGDKPVYCRDCFRKVAARR